MNTFSKSNTFTQTSLNVPPQSVAAISKTKYCCVCASAGHLAEYCRHALRIMDNPAQPIKIQSYTETYQRLENTEINPDGSQLDGVAPFALVSVPLTHYNFNWSVKEEPERLYGRIVKTTQFERTQFKMVSKKRKMSERNSKTIRKIRQPNKEGDKMVVNPMSILHKKLAKSNSSGEVDSFDVVDEYVAPDDDSNDDEKMKHENLKEEALSESSIKQVVEMDITSNKPQLNEEIDADAGKSVETAEIEDKNASEDQIKSVETNDELNIIDGSELAEKELISISAEFATNPDMIPDSDKSHTNTLINFSFTSALEEIEQQKQSSKNQFELSFLIQNKETPTEESTENQEMDRPKTPPPPNISFVALSENETDEICAEMHRLEKQEEMLNQLKHTIISTQRSKRIPERMFDGSEDAVGYHVELSEDFDEAAAEAENAHDSDSNYSFSDYFAKHQELSIPKTTAARIAEPDETVKMPDFIPIGHDDDDMVLPNTQDMIEPIQSMEKDNPSKYTEAKIFLTKDHSKYLLTRTGGTFLTETYTKHNVIVRMEWRSIGNILVVQGKPSAQDSFHADLIAYCTSAENQMRKKQEISQQVPKNRLTLIRFLKDQISQLEKPLAYAKEVFVRMKINEQQRSKTGTKNADKARKTLNMILFGQTGLRDGAMHLTALQSNLRCLIENETKEVISNVFRNEVFQHYKYIFSSFSHDNYAELVREYEKLRKNKQLPVLKLDRKLLGLKISVNHVFDAININTVTDPVADTTTQQNVATISNARSADANEPTANQQLTKQIIAAKIKTEISIKKLTDKDTNTASCNVDLNPIIELENITELGEASTNHRNTPYDRNPDALPSKIWSIKCSEYIEKCRGIPKIRNNEKAMARLQQVDVKAKNLALSYTDFRMLMKIFDKCV